MVRFQRPGVRATRYSTRDITLSPDTASSQRSPSFRSLYADFNLYTNKNSQPLMRPCDVFLVVFYLFQVYIKGVKMYSLYKRFMQAI